MQNIISIIWQKIISKDTWKRAGYLMRYHDPGELPRSIQKDDYIPVALGVILSFLLMGMVMVIVWLITK